MNARPMVSRRSCFTGAALKKPRRWNDASRAAIPNSRSRTQSTGLITETRSDRIHQRGRGQLLLEVARATQVILVEARRRAVAPHFEHGARLIVVRGGDDNDIGV